MKIEFLVLVTNDDSFCNNKKAFIDFLQVDSLISITGQKLAYRKTAKSKPIITVKFNVETSNIPSNKERYFIIALENSNEELIDEFSEVGNKIKEICKRINHETAIINVLWDDVGRYYAYKSYPLINDVENVMRKLISKFMLINVGMDWSKQTIHPDLVKKIANFEDNDAHINDLYKLDFINLSDVLFQKKRDIALEELDRVLAKTRFDDVDKDKILRYLPKSNWEKYFSELLGEHSKGLEAKWELLYKLRNKVAHNRFLTKEDFGKINGLVTQVKETLNTAMNKLGEINLDEEDRNQIINSYHSEHPYAQAYLAEKSVAEYYLSNGFEIEKPDSRVNNAAPDLILIGSDGKLAVEIKSFSARGFMVSMRMRLESAVMQVERCMQAASIEKGMVIIVVRGDADKMLTSNILLRINAIRSKTNPNITINIGAINEFDDFEMLEV